MVNIKVRHCMANCLLLVFVVTVMGSTSAEWSLKVPIYCGPHIGHQLLSWVFFTRRGLSTGPMGIQDTETLGILDGIDGLLHTDQ